MAALPTLASFGLAGPVYLRKLPKKGSWGDSISPLESRLEEAIRTVFLRDPKPYSLFLVANDEDLFRVTMGINSGRGSLKEEVPYLPILPEDLQDVGLRPEPTPGDTRCPLANARHFDLPAEEEQIRALCRKVMETNRPVLFLKRNQLTDWEQRTKDDGCLSHKDSKACRVVGCPPHNAAISADS